MVGSILMDINEEWVTGRRYLNMEKEGSGKETGLRQIKEDLRRYRYPLVVILSYFEK
jgi:hypothetical protein